jgi:hypothetical protein
MEINDTKYRNISTQAQFTWATQFTSAPHGVRTFFQNKIKFILNPSAVSSAKATLAIKQTRLNRISKEGKG